MNADAVTSTEALAASKPSGKRYRRVLCGALICCWVFIVTTGFLGYQVGLYVKLFVKLNLEMDAAQRTINDFKSQEPICNTKACVVSAASLMEAMDPTVDPCQDFYQFACGGWLRKNTIPATNSGWNQFTVLREEATLVLKDVLTEPSTFHDSKPVNNSRDMYKACMDTEAIESLGLSPLTDILEAYGQWPMAFSNWTANRFDWRSMSTSIRKDLGSSFLFQVYNYLDWKDTNKSSIYVNQAGLGLPYSTLINARSNSTIHIMKAYAGYVIESAKAVRDAIEGGTNDSTIISDVEEMINFQIELAKIQTKPEMRRNRTRMYNPMKLKELQYWTDSVNFTNSISYVNWTEYLNDIYSVVNISIPENERIIVVEPDYIRKLILLLDRTPIRVLANYMHWRLVTSLDSYTNQLMSSASFKFSKVLYGTPEPQPRWRKCVGQVASALGFAVGAAYVERAFDPEAKQEAMKMIGNLKTAFKLLVQEANWMDEETKIRALEKAAAMKEFVAYPEWIRNNSELSRYYDGVETTDKGFFGIAMNVARFLEYSELKELRLPADREAWSTFPSVVNAYYTFFYNAITFPAAIFQPPFFSKGRLAAQNYGGIGAVIGHEITHGFDDMGRQTDKDGHMKSWWSNETLTRYLEGAECFIEQYGNFTFPQFAETEAYRINGIISQGENIADNGGVREAFAAYQSYVKLNGREPRLPGLEKYTPEQLFFISYANIWCGKQTPQSLKQQILNGPHSPGQNRVLGVLSNSIEFSHHFQCSQTSAMNPPKKCILW